MTATIDAPAMAPAPTTEELVATLGELGSAEAIADFFLREGVRGRRYSRFGCPVAKWLHVVTGERHVVNPTAVRRVYGPGGEGTRIGLPREAADFICDFDAGMFPALVVGQAPARVLIFEF